MFVRALLRLVRGDAAGRRSDVRRFAVALIGFVLLAVLPGSRLVGVLTAPSEGPPRILAAFGDWLGGEGYPHVGAHRGIDLYGRVGTDVLAAADGRVVVARDNRDLCGLIVGIVHEPEGYRTVYCHFSEIVVREDPMRRMAGCFDAAASYPIDRLVLTYPLPCRARELR